MPGKSDTYTLPPLMARAAACISAAQCLLQARVGSVVVVSQQAITCMSAAHCLLQGHGPHAAHAARIEACTTIFHAGQSVKK